MNIRVVPSATLDRWDAKHVMASAWLRPTSECRPFGEVGDQRVEVNTSSSDYGSVHFDGRISKRPRGTVIKGITYLAYPDDVVFSRIDVRNGAIGVMPHEFGPLAFTNEYPIFDVATKGLLLPSYVKLLCRTSVFRSQVRALDVGHSGRKRVSAKVFMQMRVPVPDLAEQRAIADEHAARVAEAEAMRAAAPLIRSDAIADITERLGLRSPDVAPIRGGFVVQLRDLSRWSVYAGVAATRGFSEDLESHYPVAELGSLDLAQIRYGISKSPKNRPGRNGRPYLRVANVQDGFLDLREVKYIDVPSDQFALFKLERDDVLLCEGNSLELVGRPALWADEIPECVHQNHILRVRCNRENLLPGYLLAYMQTAPSRGHFRRRAKKTTNLASINKTDVSELPVPIPPLDVQSEIADLWTMAQAEAQRLIDGAKDDLAAAERNAELSVVGI